MTIKNGMTVALAGLSVGGGLVSTTDAYWSGGDARLSPSVLTVASLSTSAAPLDVFSSAAGFTKNTIFGKVGPGVTGASVLQLLEGGNSVFQVSPRGCAALPAAFSS